MDVFKEVKIFIEELLEKKAKSLNLKKLDFSKLTIEPPKVEKFGDMSTNAAMVLSRQFKTNPKNLGNDILLELKKHEKVSNAEIVGPGFINIFLKKPVLNMVLKSIKEQEDYGESNFFKGEKINIEFVSANPTGPLHIGHTRGAVYGDVIANLFKSTGADVVKEYYINDAGAQIDILGKSLYQRYLEFLGKDFKIEDNMYPGEYLISVAKKLHEKFSDKLVKMEAFECLQICKKFALEEMMLLIKNDLGLLGVKHDVFSSEKLLIDKGQVNLSIEELESKNLLYKGSLSTPKSSSNNTTKIEEHLLFKSTNFGDDEDRVLIKNNGQKTYFASDVAYHYDKFKRGYKKQINVWGVDHAGYVKRMISALNAISEDKAKLKIILCNLVKIVKDGEVLRMSKRAGNFVTLADLLKEVPKDVVRLYMMMRKSDAEMDFDVGEVIKNSIDNPIFQIRETVERINSIFIYWKEKNIFPELKDFKYDFNKEEFSIARLLSTFPRVVESSAINFEPQRITFFLISLSRKLKPYILSQIGDVEKDSLTDISAKLYLLDCVKKVMMKSGFLLGIDIKGEVKVYD